MAKQKVSNIDKVVVSAKGLNSQQPLGRFLIILFRQFEMDLVSQLERHKITDVTSSDFHILRNIVPQGSTLKEIVVASGVSKQAISQIAESLAYRGYIKINPAKEDRRVKRVLFTEKGRELIEICISIIEKIEKRYADLLGGSANLQKVKSNLNTLIQETATD